MAAEIVPEFRVGSVLVVALVGINLMAQAVPMTLRNGLGLMVRIAVASAFLSCWTNFNNVYGVLINAPIEIGAVLDSYRHGIEAWSCGKRSRLLVLPK